VISTFCSHNRTVKVVIVTVKVTTWEASMISQMTVCQVGQKVVNISCIQ